jgi:dipeptidyl aminopeptidase/acylaminoacyl peptidase
MRRIPTCLIPICITAALLAACNLSQGGSSEPTFTRATFPPTNTFTPTETVPAAEPTVTIPGGTITVTLAPTPEPDSPDASFQSKVKGGRMAYYVYTGPGEVCAMEGDWTKSICTPAGQYFDALELAWSPAGDRVAFADGKLRLQMWTLGGGVTMLLKAGAEENLHSPDWSPDGKVIAYASNALHRKADKTPGGGELELSDIFTVSVETGAVTWITRLKAADNWTPRFSPDGSKLAYISARILKYPDGTTRPSTYQVTLQDITDLTRPPVALTEGEAYELSPESSLEWSPDGKQILFYGKRLFVANADGSGVRQVGGTYFAGVSNPTITWLPNGSFALINNGFVNLLTGDTIPVYFNSEGMPYRWVFPKDGVALAPIPLPNCAADWTNLYAGATAIVAGGSNDPPNRVRSGPGKDNEVIYQVYPGTLLKVVEGPVCADGLVYWKVEYEKIPGGSGWTAEGDLAEYWLKLYRP